MPQHRISFEIIENSGPNNLRDVLKQQLTSASEVCIAVAFVTMSGLNEIEQSLRRASNKGGVRLVTGLYQNFTEPKALKELLRIQKQTNGRFQIRLSKEPQFHRKIYLLEGKIQTVAIIGSSNLTREGLRSGGEINVVVTSSKNASSSKKLKGVFEKEWKHRAVLLSAGQIKKYEKLYRAQTNHQKSTSSQLKKILGVEPAHIAAISGPAEQINYWRSSITGFASKKTEKIINETTNWDEKNYGWFSTGGSHPYQIGHRIFLCDSPDKRFLLVEVKDITRAPIPTPDGRHFVAYRHIRKRRFSKRLWQQLKDEGILKSNAKNSTVKKVRIDQAKHLIKILRNK